MHCPRQRDLGLPLRRRALASSLAFIPIAVRPSYARPAPGRWVSVSNRVQITVSTMSTIMR